MKALKKWLDEGEKPVATVFNLVEIAAQYGYTEIVKVLTEPLLAHPVNYFINHMHSY